MNTFHALGLNAALLQAIDDMGFETPSEVQAKTIPLLLENETDIVALAQTGTGKTAGFLTPCFKKLISIVASIEDDSLPTRELCLQITQELKHYAKHLKGINIVAIYGRKHQRSSEERKKGAQILVATLGGCKTCSVAA